MPSSAAVYDPQTNWYPLLITEWEMRHGIFRYEHNGMLYITTGNWDKTCQSIDTENRRRYASEKSFEYHEQHQPAGGGKP
jgi:hypothetical protein